LFVVVVIVKLNNTRHAVTYDVSIHTPNITHYLHFVQI